MTAALSQACAASFQEQLNSSKQHVEHAHEGMNAAEVARVNLQKEMQENADR